MTFDFLLGPAALGFSQGLLRRLDPTRLCDDCRGLSGTEVNALGLAYALAAQGHTVCAWSYWTQEALCRTEKSCVHFLQLTEREHHIARADVAIAFHDPQPLRLWQARQKFVWHQTITPPDYLSMRYDTVDGYISATLHNAWWLSRYTPPEASWSVIANGWDFGTYCTPAPVPGRLVYHTSPERGLHVLLKAMPLIHARVPEAHLVIWCRLETAMEHHRALWEQIRDGLETCAPYVEVHGQGGSRNQVLQALAQAAVFAYPSEPNMPCEVMPMSVLEACAAGVPVVAAPSDKFEKAFGRAIDVSPSPPSGHLDAFVDRVCRVLTDPGWALSRRERGQHLANRLTLDKTASHLVSLCTRTKRQGRLSARSA